MQCSYLLTDFQRISTLIHSFSIRCKITKFIFFFFIFVWKCFSKVAYKCVDIPYT